jgi:transposase-like protein
MAKSILSEPHFHNEEAAFAFVEERLWPNGPVCPKCGATDDHIGALKGKTTRVGLYKCYACRQPFTVRIGTIFESSHLKLHLWLQAIYLLCSSKKGISTRQLQRTLGCGMKTAWFLGHRIREAMKDDILPPLGGTGSTVEVDETFWGQQGYEYHNDAQEGQGGRKAPGWKRKRGTGDMMKVVTLVERGGRARSIKVDDLKAFTVRQVVLENLKRESNLMTDQARHYRRVGQLFASHETVDHGKHEYVRGDVTTNTVEGFFSIFKRGMRGIYQHCNESHLHRYCAEFDFRYNNREALGANDLERTDNAIKGFAGKRLTYQTTR